MSSAVALADGELVVGGRDPRKARRPPRNWRRAITPVALVAAWQAAASAGWVDTTSLSSPVQVAQSFWHLAADGQLWSNLEVSLQRVALGLALGISTGLVLGVVSGLSRLGEHLIDAPVHMLRTMPALALVPLFILWFGIGETPKVLLVALATTFPVYLNTYAGIRNIDERLIEAGTVLGLDRTGLIRDLVLPGALPSVLVGLRYSLAIAWLVLVAAEQINATAGIGYLMTNAQEFLQTDVIFVGLAVYSILGLLSDLIVRLLEWRLLAWRRGFQAR
ncbi:MAG TPA: ABC transporter permease subunit [Baekduia sp.]|nr:ABC transporter permease subunit [Baekduia sp.]